MDELMGHEWLGNGVQIKWWCVLEALEAYGAQRNQCSGLNKEDQECLRNLKEMQNGSPSRLLQLLLSPLHNSTTVASTPQRSGR